MSTIAPQFDALPLLYEQYRLYTSELGETHTGLGKLYKKLTKIERKLEDKAASELSRVQHKKLWWTKNVTRQSIEKLEAQKNDLHSRLQQCQDLIASYQIVATPASIWTPHFPPTPYIMATPISYPPTPFVMTPFTPYPVSPWPVIQPAFVGQQQDPRHWDLSMLAETQTTSLDSSVYLNTEPHDDQSGVEALNADEIAGASVRSINTTGSSVDEVGTVGRSHSLPAHIDTDKANQHQLSRKAV